MTSVEKQVDMIADNFDISIHAFTNQIIGGLRERIEQAAPGLNISPTSKVMMKGSISLSLAGRVVVKNADDVSDADDKLRQLMDSLKNPTNLLSLLDQ